MPNSAPGFLNRPDHRVDGAGDPRRQGGFRGMTIADSIRPSPSKRAVTVQSTFAGKGYADGSAPPNGAPHRCPFKGEASYWTIEAGGRRSGKAI